MHLENGEPQKFDAAEGEWRYFNATVPTGEPIAISLTPLTGEPDLFVSTKETHPDEFSAEWSSTSLTSVEHYDHVEISADDKKRCKTNTCTFNIGVLARTETTFSIAAVWGKPAPPPLKLRNGLPQSGTIAKSGESASYRVRAASSLSDLTFALTLASGEAHIFVSTSKVPTAKDFQVLFPLTQTHAFPYATLSHPPYA